MNKKPTDVNKDFALAIFKAGLLILTALTLLTLILVAIITIVK